MYQLYKGDNPLATFVPKDASELPYSNGVSVKDKIDSMANLKVVKTVNANTYSSWSQAIQSLYNDYLLLSPKEQINCVVRRATQVVYRLSNQTAKFTTYYTTPYSQVSFQEMDLQNGTFIDFTVSASGTTRSDLSSNTQNQVLELIVV